MLSPYDFTPGPTDWVIASEHLPPALADAVADGLARAGIVSIPRALADSLAHSYQVNLNEVGGKYAEAYLERIAYWLPIGIESARAKWGDRATWSRGRGYHEAGTELAR